MRYLAPSYGGVLVDMSCGSGLFSRRQVQELSIPAIDIYYPDVPGDRAHPE